MTTIEKKNIKKEIVYINTKELEEKEDKKEDEMNASFRSVTNTEPTQTVEIKVQSKPSPNFSKPKQIVTEVLHTVQQHPEEDDDELEERKKKIEEEIKEIDVNISKVKIDIEEAKVQVATETKRKSIVAPHLLLIGLIMIFLFGGLAKRIIIG